MLTRLKNEVYGTANSMAIKVGSILPVILNVGWKVILYLVILTTVLISSFAIYGAFHSNYMPLAVHVKPVFFKFSSDCDRGIGDGVCSYPHATIYLRDSTSSHKSDGERILTRGQKYAIRVELLVPRSPFNQKFGMFMVEVKFFTKSDTVVDTSSRIALLRYRSPIMYYLGTIFDFFPLHFGWKEETDKINVVLFEQFIDDSYHPTEKATVTVHSKHIQIYSAHLHISAIFTGVRYYMYYWPVTSAVLGITINILMVTILIALFYGRFHVSDTDDRPPESQGSYEISTGGSELDSRSIRESLNPHGNNNTNPRTSRIRTLSPSHARRLFINTDESNAIERLGSDQLTNARVAGLTRQRHGSGRSSAINAEQRPTPNSVARQFSAINAEQRGPLPSSLRTIESQTEVTYSANENRTDSEYFDTIEDLSSLNNPARNRTEAISPSSSGRDGIRNRTPAARCGDDESLF